MSSEHGEDYRGVVEWQKDIDHQVYEAQHGWIDGYYVGSKNEALQHKWWCLIGFVAGFVAGAMFVIALL